MTKAEYDAVEARVRAIQKKITAEPLLYDQGDWANETSCGTVCCIAGHAVMLEPTFNGFLPSGVHWKDKDGNMHDMFDTATRALAPGYTHLFTGGPEVWWPKPFNERWHDTTKIGDKKARRVAQAAVACDMLDCHLKLLRVGVE